MSELETLTKKFIEEIQKSHVAVSYSVSSFMKELKDLVATVNEMKTEFAVMNENLKDIVEQDKIRNNRLEKCEKDISSVEKDITALQTIHCERDRWYNNNLVMAGMIITMISGLIGVIYYNQDQRLTKVMDILNDHMRTVAKQ